MLLTIKARHLVGTSCLGMMLACAPAVSAQETGPQDAETQRAGIEDIVVTANRRTENVQDVPLSITAISSSDRSEEHTSELQSLMRISYAVFCLKKKKKQKSNTTIIYST